MRNSPLVHLLFSAGLPAFGYEFRHHSLADRALLVQEIQGRQGVVVIEAQSVTMVEVEKENTIYLITEPGHFAHPSVLKRTLVRQKQRRSVEVSGFTACSSETMSTWMAQFKEQDAQMRQLGVP